MHEHFELGFLATGFEHDLTRLHFEVVEFAACRFIVLRAGRDPALQQLMFPRVLFEAFLALVLHLRGGLRHEQAVRGVGQIHPRIAFAAVGVLRQFLVIRVEVVAEQ